MIECLTSFWLLLFWKWNPANGSIAVLRKALFHVQSKHLAKPTVKAGQVNVLQRQFRIYSTAKQVFS